MLLTYFGRDFPEELQGPPKPDLPLRHRPARTPPPGPDSDPISTRFRPEKGDFRSKSGRNRVEIGSKSGPGGGVRVGRCRRGRSGWEGPCDSSESLYTLDLDLLSGNPRNLLSDLLLTHLNFWFFRGFYWGESKGCLIKGAWIRLKFRRCEFRNQEFRSQGFLKQGFRSQGFRR